MTMCKGILLFDTPEPTINGWENQLGYRGMKEVWKKEDVELHIDLNEDEDGYWEITIEFNDGNFKYLDFYHEDFDEVDAFAKNYMKHN